jgi:hypothetical protein
VITTFPADVTCSAAASTDSSCNGVKSSRNRGVRLCSGRKIPLAVLQNNCAVRAAEKPPVSAFRESVRGVMPVHGNFLHDFLGLVNDEL